MARTKYTPVKYPGGKFAPRTSKDVVEKAKAEVKRHKERIDELFKKLPRISVRANMPITKTKATLKAALDKKKQMKRKLLSMVKKRRMKDKLEANLPMLETVAKKK